MAKSANTTNPIPRKCSVEGCDRKAKSIGLCNAHYLQHKAAGRPEGSAHFKPLKDTGPRGVPRSCNIPDCDRRRYCGGFCARHYKRQRLQNGALCSIGGCDRRVQFGSVCEGHKGALKRNSIPKKLKARNGAVASWIAENVTHDGQECLHWPFARDASGRARTDGALAARAMCIAAHGPPPFKGAEAAHSCGKATDGCVNPTHLRWATRKENAADRLLHGTTNRGAKHYACRLQPEQVLQIYTDKRRPSVVAREFGCSIQNVNNIQSRRNWAWLTTNYPKTEV